MNTPETMTKHDFGDLTPPSAKSVWPPRHYTRNEIIDAARWGAEQAAERLKGQWPEPITRPPTEEDADDRYNVYIQDSGGYWYPWLWSTVAHKGWPWLHTPRWQPPAPPTLKERALKVLKPPIPVQLHDGSRILKPHEIDVLLRALEADS